MITYALDSDTISYILKEAPHVLSKVRTELIQRNKLIIPPLVYYEVRRGLLSVDAPVNTAAFKRFCERIPVGRMNRTTLEEGAQVYASLKTAGNLIGDADILIAAFCIIGKYTLVSNNAKHFQRIDGLKLENWVE